jgi:HPr kinase/phosphorylase
MSGGVAAPLAIHATAFVVGEAGVLVRGPSGAGKTALALACIAQAKLQGRFAALIGDDRVILNAAGKLLVAAPHAAIAGQAERRGLAIEPGAHLAAAVIRLCVDLVDARAGGGAAPRLPWNEDCSTEIAGVSVRALAIDLGRDRADQIGLVLAALRAATRA